MYDVEATYRCLTKRPEFHWTPDAPGRTRLMFIVPSVDSYGPPGNPTTWYYDDYKMVLGPGRVLPVVFFGRSDVTALVMILDGPQIATALYRKLEKPSFYDWMTEQSSMYRRENLRYQAANVFIQWSRPSPPSRARSIVLGCLRTRAS